MVRRLYQCLILELSAYIERHGRRMRAAEGDDRPLHLQPGG